MRASYPTTRTTRGVTILELLIVVLILMMVTAAAIPIMAPAMRNRQMRESSRLVSSYFQSARARAIETGRPVGVKIERFDGQPFAFTLSQIEVPPPYAGDALTSRMLVAVSGTPSMSALFAYKQRYQPYGLTPRWFSAQPEYAYSFNPAMASVGDQIQFGHKGPHYTILGPDANSDGLVDGLTLDIAYLYTGTVAGFAFPWENSIPPPPVPYQIFRQAVRSATAPLQLPQAIVIDLACSGIGSDSFMDRNNSYFDTSTSMLLDTNSTSPPGPVVGPLVPFDPVILFSPSGNVQAVSQGIGTLSPVADTVYLLVGRRELMYDATQKGLNSADAVAQNLSPIMPVGTTLVPPPPEHFWVAVGNQSGRVTVAEVAPNLQVYKPSGPAIPQSGVSYNALPAARFFARSGQGVGGK